jgi:hypothetical protein
MVGDFNTALFAWQATLFSTASAITNGWRLCSNTV